MVEWKLTVKFKFVELIILPRHIEIKYIRRPPLTANAAKTEAAAYPLPVGRRGR